jgi:dTMP kinase
VAIEGIDGAGKTTQANLLLERLQKANIDALCTKEPTNGAHGQRIKQSATEGRLPVREELALFIADRKEHVEEVLAPALAQGKVVIVDRYYFSTAAYQGARGVPADEIIAMNEAFAPEPNLLVLLEISVATAMRRITDRAEDVGNHFERRSALQKCAAIFGTIKRPYLLRIDGERGRADIHNDIVHALDEGPLFRSFCQTKYRTECEPEYCTPRIVGTCQYPQLDIRRLPQSR